MARKPLQMPMPRRARRQQSAGQNKLACATRTGRIIDALGYSPAKIVEEKVDIGYSLAGRKILWSLKRGQPTKATSTTLCRRSAEGIRFAHQPESRPADA